MLPVHHFIRQSVAAFPLDLRVWGFLRWRFLPSAWPPAGRAEEVQAVLQACGITGRFTVTTSILRYAAYARGCCPARARCVFGRGAPHEQRRLLSRRTTSAPCRRPPPMPLDKGRPCGRPCCRGKFMPLFRVRNWKQLSRVPAARARSVSGQQNWRTVFRGCLYPFLLIWNTSAIIHR